MKIKPSTNPFESVKINFYDDDFLQDDYLGSYSPNYNGVVTAEFKLEDFQTFDSFLEKHPDLYFTIIADGEKLYTSEPIKNVTENNYRKKFYSTDIGMILDLGEYALGCSFKYNKWL